MTDIAVSTLVLETNRDGNVATVLCRGKLVTGTTQILQAEVIKLIPGSRRIILDLTNLTFMDSSGLGTLVRLYVSCKSAGCDLELINLGQRIRQLFEISNLLSVFTVVGEHGIRIS